MQGRIAGVMINGAYPNMSVSIRGGGTPLFLLNGMQVEMDMIMMVNPNDVESIDVLKGASAAIYGMRGGNGVIAVYTKNGEFISKPTVGIHDIKYPGFYRAREFYSPNYEVPIEEHNFPDIRTTLYWNPSIRTDKDGNAKVSFYTSDVTSSHTIKIEGVSKDGIPGTDGQSLNVEN